LQEESKEGETAGDQREENLEETGVSQLVSKGHEAEALDMHHGAGGTTES
jgi:hypothetical protein